MYNKRTSFGRGLLYTFRSSNKQLNHRFLHFVVSLQSKFYTLAPAFVFDVNIYFSSSRLLTFANFTHSRDQGSLHTLVLRSRDCICRFSIFYFNINALKLQIFGSQLSFLSIQSHCKCECLLLLNTSLFSSSSSSSSSITLFIHADPVNRS